MNSPSLSPFEDKIRQAAQMPEPKPEFVDALWNRMSMLQQQPSTLARRFFLRPAWYAMAAIILLLIIAALIVGPQRVYAAVRQLFGYIPGVGIVDQSAPIRVLAGPVSVTREGISLTVTSAVLTGDKTHIEYRIFGVPGSDYPDREDVAGCYTPEYLRLPDGTHLERSADFPPVPAGVNQAVFVLPCIPETLPGKAPENWEVPLRFVPAPPDLTVMPVIELSPSPQIQNTLIPSPSAGATGALPIEVTGTLPVEMTGTSTAAPEVSVTVDQVIETSDGYILVGELHPQVQNGARIGENGDPQITDANGKKVSYSIAEDIATPNIVDGSGGFGWAYKFKAAGLTFPLTITFSGVKISEADPQATASFEFDAGDTPQPGQVWTLNQDILLAGHTLKLVSITADSAHGGGGGGGGGPTIDTSDSGGYSFSFQVDPAVNGVGVDIAGYTPSGGGGGGGGGTTSPLEVSISYDKLPKGKLQVTLSHLTVVSDTVTWQGQWSPNTPAKVWPTAPASQSGVCLTVDSLAQLKPAPADLTGKALLYEILDAASNQWGLVLYNMDGSGKQVLVSDGSGGSFSPDGSQMAYPSTDGIHIIDLVTKAEKVLAGATGFDLHWSPDGKQIAYVGAGNSIIDSVFVVNSDGTQMRQVSTWSYEAILGWSPDSTQLYFVAPYTGGAAWKVYSLGIATGKLQERFTIENGTPKFLNPKLSPDGQWIAYRGRDNSSLYLVHTDGSDMHLLVDNAGVVGVEWSQSGWLGVSMQKANSDVSNVVLIKPDGCEAYLLPALNGELEGLYLP